MENLFTKSLTNYMCLVCDDGSEIDIFFQDGKIVSKKFGDDAVNCDPISPELRSRILSANYVTEVLNDFKKPEHRQLAAAFNACGAQMIEDIRMGRF